MDLANKEIECKLKQEENKKEEEFARIKADNESKIRLEEEKTKQAEIAAKEADRVRKLLIEKEKSRQAEAFERQEKIKFDRERLLKEDEQKAREAEQNARHKLREEQRLLEAKRFETTLQILGIAGDMKNEQERTTFLELMKGLKLLSLCDRPL